jgi:hypothetical protein
MRLFLIAGGIAALSIVGLMSGASARSCDEIAAECIKRSANPATIPKCRAAGAECKANGGTFNAPSGRTFFADTPKRAH